MRATEKRRRNDFNEQTKNDVKQFKEKIVKKTSGTSVEKKEEVGGGGEEKKTKIHRIIE